MKQIFQFIYFSLAILFTLTHLHPSYAEPTNSNPSHPQTIVIIGGGMAGIAAATFLKDSRYQVHLFESKGKLGGHAQTQQVTNSSGNKIGIDLGPQYFSPGPWDLYIDFLKFYNLYQATDQFSFSGKLTSSTPEQVPYFVTPGLNLHKLLFNLHLNKLTLLYRFYQFNKKAYKLFKSKNEDDYLISVQEWLDREKFNKQDQEELFLPFLGTLIGVTNNEARNLSMLALTKLFAFSSPLSQKKFTVLRHGMGEIINTIGTRLEERPSNITIHRGATVASLRKNGSKFRVHFYQEGNIKKRKLTADKVISAIHPFQLLEILPKSDPLIMHLNQLKYVENRIVLHNSNLFQRNQLSSVIDIESSNQGRPFLTMNMGKINKKQYGAIYKSWINDDEIYAQLQMTQSILGEARFKHPVVTPSFVIHCNLIRSLLQSNPIYCNLSIAGGWTELTETQSTAILSGFKAVQKVCPEVIQEKDWASTLPTLKHAA